jgi:hypothetical protein
MMIQQNELIMLLLGIGGMVFILLNIKKVKRIPGANTLVAGYYVLLGGYVLTLLEGFFWKDLLNIIEHICYAASSVLIAIWCWKIFSHQKDTK